MEPGKNKRRVMVGSFLVLFDMLLVEGAQTRLENRLQLAINNKSPDTSSNGHVSTLVPQFVKIFN